MSPVPAEPTSFIEIPLRDLERGVVTSRTPAPPSKTTSKPNTNRTRIFFHVLFSPPVVLAFLPTAVAALLVCLPAVYVGATLLGLNSPVDAPVDNHPNTAAFAAGIAVFILLPSLLGGPIHAALEPGGGTYDDETDEERHPRLLVWIHCVIMFTAVHAFFFYAVGGLLVNAVAAARDLPLPLSREDFKHLLAVDAVGVAVVVPAWVMLAFIGSHPEACCCIAVGLFSQ